MTLSEIAPKTQAFQFPGDSNLTFRKISDARVEVLQSINRPSITRGQQFCSHPLAEVNPLQETKSPKKKKK